MAEVKRIATRKSYGEALVEIGAVDKDVVVLDADLGGSTMTAMFKEHYPDRFFDCGIAEANMIGVAAGLAASGKKPFASSFAMFAAGRAFEQIRNSVGYPKLPVKICATHAGISVGEDGATHQCCEDMALMRAIPGMTIINPADDVEAKAAIKAIVNLDGPVYVRLGRLPVPVFNDEKTYHFELGKGITMRDGEDITIVATGLMVYEALGAADLLAKEGIHSRVIDVHTIKPIDEELLVKAARETGVLVTVEEHSVVGGLGEAVSSVLCAQYPARVIKLGIQDEYGISGPALELLDYYGLTAPHIAEQVKKAYHAKIR